MNQLSLQVITWGMVATVVFAALWLARMGDAAQLERHDALTPMSLHAKALSQRPGNARSAGTENRAAGRTAERAPVSLTARPPRAHDDRQLP